MCPAPPFPSTSENLWRWANWKKRSRKSLKIDFVPSSSGRWHLIFRKLFPSIPSAEIDTKLRDIQSPQRIPGCVTVKLNPTDDVLEHFSSAPRKHLHIIVEAPPTRVYSPDLSLPVSPLLFPSSSLCFLFCSLISLHWSLFWSSVIVKLNITMFRHYHLP